MRVTTTLVTVTLCGLLVLGTAGIVVEGHIERDWSDLGQRADAAQADVQARWIAERPVLFGEPGSGEAFDHYFRAIELVLRDEQAGRRAPTLMEMLAATDEQMAAHVAHARDLASILLELRRGARAPRASFELDWESGEPVWDEGAGYRGLRSTSAQRLSRIAFTVFLTELDRGHTEAALGVLLDSLQFARDLAATPLLTEGVCGAQLLVPSFLEELGEEGGWSLFSEAELSRWIDALETVDDDLGTLGDAILVETILDVRRFRFELLETEAKPQGWNPISRALGSVVSAVTEANVQDAYGLMFDFQEEHAEAFEVDPIRRPVPVCKKYERMARGEGMYALFLVQQSAYATTDRLHGLVRLRLLRHALGTMVGREDVPSTERMGLPIHSEDADGVCRSYIEPGCRKAKGCCPSVIQISLRKTH